MRMDATTRRRQKERLARRISRGRESLRRRSGGDDVRDDPKRQRKGDKRRSAGNVSLRKGNEGESLAKGRQDLKDDL